MSAGALAQIEVAREFGLGSADRRRQRIASLRNRDQVHVIRHQAISQQAKSRAFAPVAQQVEIELIIEPVEKHLLPSIAALRDVIRYSFKDNARDSRHPPTESPEARIFLQICV